MKRILRAYYPYLWMGGFYSLYLLSLPHLLWLRIPCLGSESSAQSFTHQSCNFTLVMDTFTILMMIGYGLALLGLWIWVGSKRLQPVILFGLSLGALSVSAYYAYLYGVSEKIIATPILLKESFGNELRL